MSLKVTERRRDYLLSKIRVFVVKFGLLNRGVMKPLAHIAAVVTEVS
jgi:hypothetical protein